MGRPTQGKLRTYFLQVRSSFHILCLLLFILLRKNKNTVQTARNTPPVDYVWPVGPVNRACMWACCLHIYTIPMTCRAVNICGASAYLYTRADCRGKKKGCLASPIGSVASCLANETCQLKRMRRATLTLPRQSMSPSGNPLEHFKSFPGVACKLSCMSKGHMCPLGIKKLKPIKKLKTSRWSMSVEGYP